VLARKKHIQLGGKTIGLIGVGHVGRNVEEKAAALGLRVLRNDPPLAEIQGSAGFCSLDELQAESDIVSLHVPLVDGGPWPTRRLVNFRFLARLKPGAVLLNTARGEVVDTEALRDVLRRDFLGAVALDVWDHEPFVDPALLDRVDLGTPHIAGYSRAARQRGTWMVFQQACGFFESFPSWTLPRPDASGPGRTVTLRSPAGDEEAALAEAVRSVYDIEADDRALRDAVRADPDRIRQTFSRLRRDYPDREEFTSTRIDTMDLPPALKKKLRALGFWVSNS
jgi:erythronate-4-phosphate dehydrogenase